MKPEPRWSMLCGVLLLAVVSSSNAACNQLQISNTALWTAIVPPNNTLYPVNVNGMYNTSQSCGSMPNWVQQTPPSTNYMYYRVGQRVQCGITEITANAWFIAPSPCTTGPEFWFWINWAPSSSTSPVNLTTTWQFCNQTIQRLVAAPIDIVCTRDSSTANSFSWILLLTLSLGSIFGDTAAGR